MPFYTIMIYNASSSTMGKSWISGAYNLKFWLPHSASLFCLKSCKDTIPETPRLAFVSFF